MNKPDLLQRRRWSSIYANRLVFAIQTCSGYRACVADHMGKEYFFIFDIDDVSIGSALLDCLASSRWVVATRRNDVLQPEDIEFDPDLFDRKQVVERYQSWVGRLIEFTGCKSKSKLFKPMYYVSIEELDDFLIIHPWYQEKSAAWSGSGMQGVEDVIVPAGSSPDEIGKAVRLALSRCLSKFQSIGIHQTPIAE